MGDEQADLTGMTLGNKFLVRRRIGAGGMGAVYEVQHLRTLRVGALKLLHVSVASNPRIVERFIREASAAGRIGNRHIVETIDAGELPTGEPYMFMELLEGSSVSELIQRRGRLSFDEAREIVSQAAEGLGAAHAAGIVHRDVKPDNLLLCRGEPPYVKLLDFGISKFGVDGDHRLTTEGVPMGTPYYMSPEQVAGKSDVGPASDMYSLGVVLYECVTGRVPFDASTLPALSLKIFEGKYAPPSSVLGAAPPGLDAVIARAMATVPSQRYSSMDELRAALASLGQSLPLSLAGTLDSMGGGFDVTAEAAPPSEVAARATSLAPRPASESRLDTHAPATLASTGSRGYRGVALLAALAALAVAAPFVLRAERSPLTAPSSSAAQLSATYSVFTADSTRAALPQLSVSAVRPPSPPSASADARAPTLVAKPRPLTSAKPAPSSRAARDGLTEQNPFAE